jgi:predicted phage tail protein
VSIFGAGGGGGKGGKGGAGGRKAKEAKDNLDSTAYAKIIELLSEGEIEGFATPSKLGLTKGTTAYTNASLKDVFFNKTRLLREGASNTAPQDADFNFSNVTLVPRFGTQAQAYVPGFDAVEEEIAVNADVLEGLPITRTIADTNVDAARITINVPSLQTVKDNGDIVGAEINLQIAIQYNSGGFTTVIDDTIKGRTSDLYQRDYIVNFDGAFPIDLRITRITPDSTSVKLANAFSWFSYTELIYQKLRYPNSAYVALRIDAEQFNSIPSRSYRIRGIKVRIPSNATVDINTGRITYSGVWNGTFGAAAWTTDPAWILWDLLTNSRLGLGDHIQESTLDKWAFFQASKYCNELVPTG